MSTRFVRHDAGCFGCDETFLADIVESVLRRLPEATGCLSERCVAARVRAGVSQALRQGVTLPSAIGWYVLLMFALEPDFIQRRRIRDHIAASGGGLDSVLASPRGMRHPNCWYGVARSFGEERWQALMRRQDAFEHPLCRLARSEILPAADMPEQLSPGYGFQLDVPYVATPEQQVLAMLELAGVGRDDMVIDLGSGDGRIVIMAASRFGARGLGIEINPDRVIEAEQAALRAGVGALVSFQRQDFFDADVSQASVVTMYLLNGINLELRDHLLRQLRPGSRIVSRHFDMGQWEPDGCLGMRGDRIYCWHVPGEGV